MVIGSQRLARFGRLDRRPVVGAIASDVLSRFGTATLDYWNSRLLLASRTRSGGGRSVPVFRIRHFGFLEFLHATIKGKSVPVLLDTGADYSVIDPHTAGETGLRVVGRAALVRGATGCTVRATPVAIPRWALGTQQLPSTMALRINDPQAFNPIRIGGIVGSDVLSVFKRVTLNYRKHRLQLAGEMHRQPPQSSTR